MKTTGGSDGMLWAIRAAHEQLARVLRRSLPPLPRHRPERILVLGTGGGSAMAGEMLKRVLDRPGLPSVDVCGEYRPPAWVGPKTWALAASHSGNTKEILSAVAQCSRAGARIIALTAGGRLEVLARRRGWPIWSLTPGLMPRALLYEILGGMLRILQPEGERPVREAEKALRNGWERRERAAKTAALKLRGLMPYILGAEPAAAPCALRLKNQLAENGKLVSWAGTLPRAHHDDIVGWGQPASISRRLGAVLLRDGEEDAEIKRRFEATRNVLKGKAGAVLELWTDPGTLLARILTLCQTCDFLSAHLALMRGVAPTPVPVIDELKKRMGR